VTVR